ncbi:MAG: sodium:solute symporter family protein [Bacteroidota bacterium]
MNLATIDWVLIGAFFLISLIIGIVVSKRAGSSASEFFLSGRNMPWWLLGISMVATTFSADTPNLVTEIVRQDGVSGNWVWWCFLLTGMLTVFVYAKLWRRSGVLTDLEFYELRYSGKPAAFLRGFRAVYLGFFFNIMIMATVSLAAIKIGEVMLGLEPLETLFIASIVTVFYSSLGGLRGVLITDFFQFFIAMIGAIWAANVALNLPEVGGLSNLLSHELVADKLSLIPDFSSMSFKDLLPLFILPLAVQWWSVWYPGAEPGGGGYIAQRMLSAKNETHATGATLLFNVAHYALRPWPWIIIALCSLVVFPTTDDIMMAFPNVSESLKGDDLGYPAMLTFLPAGLLGLVLASLIAAFMSTISTHLNWGSSYLVYDFYKRFVNTEASEKELVTVGRISTILLMLLSAILALYLRNAYQAFQILLQIGAGTGLIFILRWFWWRINAYSEIAAMAISFILALYFQIIHEEIGFSPIEDEYQLIYGVIITTIGWVAVTYLTPSTDRKTLLSFYQLIQPGGGGWDTVIQQAEAEGETFTPNPNRAKLPLEILCMVIGSLTVYSALFATGFWIYGKTTLALILTVVAAGGTLFLFRTWGKLQGSSS